MWLFFQSPDERAPPWQSYVNVVDPEEQEEAVARLAWCGLVNEGCSWAPHSWRRSETKKSSA
jgi:hypothetical protein